MKPLSSNPNHDDGEEGTYDRIARGEGGSAQRESNDSSPVPAITYSHLNRADDRPESPGSVAYAVASAQPMTHATSAAYDHVNAAGDGQSPAKAPQRKTPSPSAEYAEVAKAVVPGGAEIANDGRSPSTTEEHNTPSPSSPPAQYAMVNKSGKNKKDEE